MDCFEANVFLNMVNTKQTLYIYCQLSIDKLNHRILINVWIENLSLTLGEERFRWWSKVPKFRPSKETFWEWRNLYCAKTLVYFQTATRETGNFSKSDLKKVATNKEYNTGSRYIQAKLVYKCVKHCVLVCLKIIIIIIIIKKTALLYAYKTESTVLLAKT